MDWLRDHLVEMWLGASILLGLAELVSGDLFLLMLAGGALGGLTTAALTDSMVAQVLVASGTAILLLGVVRPPLLRRLHGGPDLVLGPASLVGGRGVVTEQIDQHRPGRVKLGGESWLAVCEGPEPALAVGRDVEVVSITGATAHVRPFAEQNPPALPETP
ncbi:MAG: NfeD family protein [Nocardioidaceae bacterium]|nr:NfeD family protein [Nocardioidaceae bacterium]